MRIEWQGGWADLSERLTHARRMRIVRVLRKANSDDPADQLDFAVEIAAAHVTAWSLGEVDEVHGPERSEFDALPWDAVDLLTRECIKRWTNRADPNASRPTSDAGPSAEASE